MAKPKKQHGGHLKGFRKDLSAGSGPALEIREGLGLSQEVFAERIGLSPRALRDCEREGRWPKNDAVKRNILAEAAKGKLDVTRWPLPYSAK